MCYTGICPYEYGYLGDMCSYSREKKNVNRREPMPMPYCEMNDMDGSQEEIVEEPATILKNN